MYVFCPLCTSLYTGCQLVELISSRDSTHAHDTVRAHLWCKHQALEENLGPNSFQETGAVTPNIGDHKHQEEKRCEPDLMGGARPINRIIES